MRHPCLLSNLVAYVFREMPSQSLVDEDYGQLENLDDESRQMYPLTYPAILIEPSRVDWSQLSGDSPKGEASLRIRLIADCYDDTHWGSGTTSKILEREEMRASLYSLLEGSSPLFALANQRLSKSSYLAINERTEIPIPESLKIPPSLLGKSPRRFGNLFPSVFQNHWETFFKSLGSFWKTFANVFRTLPQRRDELVI